MHSVEVLLRLFTEHIDWALEGINGCAALIVLLLWQFSETAMNFIFIITQLQGKLRKASKFSYFSPLFFICVWCVFTLLWVIRLYIIVVLMCIDLFICLLV